MSSIMDRRLLTVLLMLPLTLALVFKITKLECEPNKVYIQNMTCRLKPINWQTSICNFDGDLLKPIHNLTLNFGLFVRNDANHYKPFLVNTTFNLCDAFSKRKNIIYSKIATNYFKKYSNINHSCPFEGHLASKDVSVDEKLLPVLPPVGFYKIVLRFLDGYPYEDIATFKVYMTIDEDSRKPKVTKKSSS